MKTKGTVLPVLIQDPAVAGETEARTTVHPVIVRDRSFREGPACRRVAVVDLDFNTGKLRRPVKLDPRGVPQYNMAAYETAIPAKRGGKKMYLDSVLRSFKVMDVEDLKSIPLKDPFMKVSVFGTVLRTLGLIQDPAVLGREIDWAFPGKQLLVVPQAAEMDNAFYHRESRSLQFYYSSGEGEGVYSGLSQDIVAHETAHAIIDGIAPDLYDAIVPESLAIHEGLADLTAALLSMRNRELATKLGQEIDMNVFQESSRFSRIAEQFGRRGGYGEALRDVCNTKTLKPRAAADRRIDPTSPHSISEVLSGLLFAVFRALFVAAPNDPAVEKKITRAPVPARQAQKVSIGAVRNPDFEGMRYRVAYASNRTLGLAYRGLDWLPPGDASFSDLVEAMLAADRAFFPDDPRVREVLTREARLRGIRIKNPKELMTLVKVPLNEAECREFGEQQREVLRIKPEAKVTVTVRSTHIYAPPPIPKSNSEPFDLTPDMSKFTSAKTEHYLIKLAWFELEPNEIEGWGKHRCYRTGATIVAAKNGRVCVVLQNPHTERTKASCSQYLGLMLKGQRATPELGPDGVVLQSGLRASLENDTLSITAAMQALHVAGDLE